MLSKLYIVAAAVSSLVSGVIASPTGAASCLGDQPAVGGAHLTKPLGKTGDLTSGSLTFAINGVPLEAGVPFDAPIGVSHTWTLSVDLEGIQARPFKGFLVRLDGGDAAVSAADSLLVTEESGEDVQPAAVCEVFDGVGGVTHTINDMKTCVIGALFLDEPSNNMPLDVTVVIENVDDKSAYFYTGFTINAVAVDPSVAASRGFGTCDAPETVPPTMSESSGSTSWSTSGETAGESMIGS